MSEVEVERLKKQLNAARVEIEELKLRLSNVTLLLQREMATSGKIPKTDFQDRKP